ncbi:hypothetical protein, partial [Acinetobacter sp. LH3_13]|uniref:hypothetical protein n=1 Tax=Acinetobacter sp. LH3_13 TaxID=3434463 RepID=UPI003EBAB726
GRVVSVESQRRIQQPMALQVLHRCPRDEAMGLGYSMLADKLLYQGDHVEHHADVLGRSRCC